MEARVMSLNPIITGLEKMLHRLLGEDVTLITSLQADLAKVRIDPGQMEQVIMNLVVNARQAMPIGGRLTVRTAQITVTSEGGVPHANVPVGAYVLLSVTDTGSGMDAETQARAFEPFFSTKGEGTGLGLSTVYGIVQQSGGYIFVDSSPGQGACFSIYLPVTSEQESGETIWSRRSPRTRGRRRSSWSRTRTRCGRSCTRSSSARATGSSRRARAKRRWPSPACTAAPSISC